MLTLGISFAHDSGVCLYEDGNIISFFKEERLTRKKRDKSPMLSLLKTINKIEKNIDCIAICPVLPTNYDIIFSILSKNGYKTDNIKIFDLSNDHHLQHASLAFYNSGFSEANIIVVDRNGSDWFNGARESETIFRASYPAQFDTLYKNFWIYHNYAQEHVFKWSAESGVEADAKSLFGLVKVYEAATTLIGQDPLENGKTMGLSAYGNKNKAFPDFFVNNTNIVNDFYFSHVTGKTQDYQSIYEDLKYLMNKEFSQNNYQEHADFSWQVQNQTQNALKYIVEKSLQKNNTKNIVLTGGYALNVLANNFLIKNFPEINFYFEPLADDSGNCIGGAMLAYRKETQDSTIIPIKNTFFHGEKYSLKNISGDRVKTDDVAKLILNNKSIAIYNGLSESGPRSLGNRSIIFNAMNPDAKALINKIKRREWYRPFAASVLESDANKYFNMLNLCKSKFMTVSFDAQDEAKKLFPGIIHIDGSSRIQTVDKDDGVLFDILLSIKKFSGHGIVLNTSFNLAGEPLVETPEDALRVLYNSQLDAVWFPEVSKIVFNKGQN